MSELKQHWLQTQQKINALSQRERVILLATMVVAVVMLMQMLLIDPLLIKRDRAQQQMQDASTKIQQQQGQINILEAQLEVGVDRAKIQRRDRLQATVDDLDQQLKKSIVTMIPPRLMPQVLEQLLLESKGLQLISMENKPVVAVLQQKTAEQGGQASKSSRSANIPLDSNVGNTTPSALYSHGFVMQLKGDYKSTIKYFERLSALPWRFHWDELRYEVGDYPSAIITLEVHTVSMAEEWIGV